MNICFLTAEVPNLRSGGIENVTFRLAKGFADRGHKVFCISLDQKSEFNEGALPFVHLTIGREGDRSEIVKEFIVNNRIDVIINQAIEQRWRDILSSVKIDCPNVMLIKVLHTDPAYLIKGTIDQEPLYTKQGNIARLLFKIKPSTIIRKLRRKQYSKQLYLDWLKFYDRIALLSSTFIDDFYSIACVRNNGKVVAISNPIEFYAEDTANNKQKIILFVGRLHREAKRPDRLLAAWRKIHADLPDWKLIFVGDGPMRVQLESFCKKHNIGDVEFVGHTDPTPYYSKASILCITSTYEGFPTVMGEALVHNVIPIAFDSFGAVKDLICDNENGFLVTPYKIGNFAAQIKYCISVIDTIRSQRRSLLNEGLHSHFSIEHIVGQWEPLFDAAK